MKYELTDTRLEFRGNTLFRVRRVKDGMWGGWVESEANLSHVGKCFVYGEAKVFGCATVREDARVFGNAVVCDKAEVTGDARVSGEATISGSAVVDQKAKVYGSALVSGTAVVKGVAVVRGDRGVFSGTTTGHGTDDEYVPLLPVPPTCPLPPRPRSTPSGSRREVPLWAGLLVLGCIMVVASVGARIKNPHASMDNNVSQQQPE